jgi:hypothetical protein
MKPGTFLFSGEWMETVKNLAETGMGYSIVTIILKDGRTFPQTIIDSGYLRCIRGLPHVPFKEGDIASIKLTNNKWDWKKEPIEGL